jgi:hypothetical protein
MITGNAKRTADKDNKATERSGKLLAKSMGTGVSMSGGIMDGSTERTTP